MYYKTEGIIIAQKNFGEADKLLTIYTESHGKLTCIAKGARRPRSKKSGHIELGNWCSLFIAKGKNLDLLTEVQLKKAFGLENLTPQKANQIYHLLEIINKLTPANQKNSEVFNLLRTYLSNISDESNFDLISSAYKVKLLAELGFFSAQSIKNKNAKIFFSKLQSESYKNLKDEISIDKKTYLKLLAFLDSMIENLVEGKLKTTKFINGSK